jgi:effector-binding domain-containing protein
MTITDPRIIDRVAQPYVAIRSSVPMSRLGSDLPPLIGEVFGWLRAREIDPAAAPFWKYNVIDMAHELEVEVGAPIATAVTGDERVIAGILPAGRYATRHHVGHPKELMEATAELLKWADREGLSWDVTDTAAGERWAARLEIFLTNPDDEPDMSKWETDLVFKLAD